MAMSDNECKLIIQFFAYLCGIIIITMFRIHSYVDEWMYISIQSVPSYMPCESVVQALNGCVYGTMEPICDSLFVYGNP